MKKPEKNKEETSQMDTRLVKEIMEAKKEVLKALAFR